LLARFGQHFLRDERCWLVKGWRYLAAIRCGVNAVRALLWHLAGKAGLTAGLVARRPAGGR
jgi:hypothetical protein